MALWSMGRPPRWDGPLLAAKPGARAMRTGPGIQSAPLAPPSEAELALQTAEEVLRVDAELAELIGVLIGVNLPRQVLLSLGGLVVIRAS